MEGVYHAVIHIAGILIYTNIFLSHISTNNYIQVFNLSTTSHNTQHKKNKNKNKKNVSISMSYGPVSSLLSAVSLLLIVYCYILLGLIILDM